MITSDSYYEDDYDSERADIAAESRAQVRAERRYQNQLAAHPDPRDPDHPDAGWDEENEEEE